MRRSQLYLASVLPVLLGMSFPVVPAAAQQARRQFRNPRATERMAVTRAAIDSFAAESRTLRKALVDSALGTATWLEFSAEQQAAERRAGTIESVVSQFLARYRAALGADDSQVQFRQAEREVAGPMVHLRFRQVWRDLPIKGGELRLHLRRAARGYVLETANGRVYSDIEAPEVPTREPSAAVAIASSQLGDSLVLDLCVL